MKCCFTTFYGNCTKISISSPYTLHITHLCHVERAQRRGISKISRYKRSLTCVIRVAHRKPLLIISLRYGRDDTAEAPTHYTLHNTY